MKHTESKRTHQADVTCECEFNYFRLYFCSCAFSDLSDTGTNQERRQEVVGEKYQRWAAGVRDGGGPWAELGKWI